MLTSFNQLLIPSPFIYSDRLVVQVVCQSVRQQSNQYWHELIELIERKFPQTPLPAPLIDGLSCGIRTAEQADFYVARLCPPTPFRWPCFRNLLLHSSMASVDQWIDDEQWPSNRDDLVDSLFAVHRTQGNASSHGLASEFHSLVTGWLKRNQEEVLHELDNEPNQKLHI